MARRSVDIDSMITTRDILDALREADHPDAKPQRTWTDDDGKVYQAHYAFDPADWDAMTDHLVRKRGLSLPSRTTVLAASSAPDVAPRAVTDPPEFYCKGYNTNNKAFTFTLGSIAGAVCQGFAWGAEYTAKKQVIERYGLQNVEGHPIRATFAYAWTFVNFAAVTECSVAFGYGINEACVESAKVPGKSTTQDATAGFKEDYGGAATAELTLSTYTG